MDGVFDQIIGATGSGGDADGEEVFFGQPVGAEELLVAMDIEVADFVLGEDAGGVSNEPGGNFFLSNFDQMGGVRAVVASDDEEEIERFVEELKEGILSVLSGSADGVEIAEIL